MLKRVDRLQVVVPDREKAAVNWARVLGAEREREDRVDCLGALRSTWRLGDGRVEFLSPDGAGRVRDALAGRGAHLFAAGFSTDRLGALTAHLEGLGIEPALESGQAFLGSEQTGGFGMQVVLSLDEELEPVGAIDTFYEATLLVHDVPTRGAQCARIFALDADNFVAIRSADYGYEGILTLFRPRHLDRFEMITPTAPEKTMGRYFARFGECYYMAFAESGALPAIEDRLQADGLGHTAVPFERPAGRVADTIFLHSRTLGGMMLGISRRTMAWQWSGRPDEVEAPR